MNRTIEQSLKLTPEEWSNWRKLARQRAIERGINLKRKRAFGHTGPDMSEFIRHAINFYATNTQNMNFKTQNRLIYHCNMLDISPAELINKLLDEFENNSETTYNPTT